MIHASFPINFVDGLARVVVFEYRSFVDFDHYDIFDIVSF